VAAYPILRAADVQGPLPYNVVLVLKQAKGNCVSRRFLRG
jgi:hypothetical protein